MKLLLLSLVALTISFVDSAHVPVEATVNSNDQYNDLDQDEEDCRPNEVWRECGHAVICDTTCENRNEPYPTCPPICVRRCICDIGHVRNGNGYCIRREECPNQGEEDCRANEVWSECGHAAICDRTCENRNEPNPTCPPICVRRCICDVGHVRNGNGYCINQEECLN